MGLNNTELDGADCSPPLPPTDATDALWENECCSGRSWYQIAEKIKLHARKMERERDVIRAKADNLHLSISVFLGDWRAGDFRLPELAAIHMSAIEEKYRAMGKVLFDMENVKHIYPEPEAL